MKRKTKLPQHLVPRAAAICLAAQLFLPCLPGHAQLVDLEDDKRGQTTGTNNSAEKIAWQTDSPGIDFDIRIRAWAGSVLNGASSASANANAYGLYLSNDTSGQQQLRTGNNLLTGSAYAGNVRVNATGYATANANAFVNGISLSNNDIGSALISTGSNEITLLAKGGTAQLKGTSAYALGNAYGLSLADSLGGQAQMDTVDNKITITAQGGNAKAELTSASFSDLNTFAGANGQGVYLSNNNAAGSTSLTTGNNEIHILASGGYSSTSLAFTGSSAMTARGTSDATAKAYGIYLFNDAQGTAQMTSLSNNIHVSATGGTSSTQVQASGNTSAIASSDAHALGIYSVTGDFQATGKQVIYTEATAGLGNGQAGKAYAYALHARNGGKILLDSQGEAVQLTGDIGILDLNSSAGNSAITVSLDNTDSFWRPRFQDTFEAGSSLHLTYATNGSFGDGSFTLKNDGVLDLAWSANQGSNKFLNRQLDLTGAAINIEDGATFVINSDLANNEADTVSSPHTATGNHYVKVAYDPIFDQLADGTTTVTGRALVLDFAGANGIGTTTITEDPLSTLTSKVTMEGGYLTNITHSNLPSQLGLTASDAYQNQLNVLRLQANSLSRRLGDLRNDDPDAKHGLWARTYGGKLKSDGAYGRTSSQKYYAMQLGYDWISSARNGKYVTGLFVDHMQSDPNYQRGSGKIKSTALGGYLSWLGDKGHYFDLVAKAARMRNRYSLYYLSGDRASASFNNWGYTLSMEYGYKHSLSDKSFLEPQAELIVGRLQGKDYTATGGVRIDQDSVNLAVGRLGLMYGWNFGKENKSSAYLKGSLVHDFSGNGSLDSYYSGNHRRVQTAGDFGSAFELNLGTNLQLSPKQNLYFELTKTFGGDVEIDWQLNAGWRMNF